MVLLFWWMGELSGELVELLVGFGQRKKKASRVFFLRILANELSSSHTTTFCVFCRWFLFGAVKLFRLPSSISDRSHNTTQGMRMMGNRKKVGGHTRERARMNSTTRTRHLGESKSQWVAGRERRQRNKMMKSSKKSLPNSILILSLRFSVCAVFLRWGVSVVWRILFFYLKKKKGKVFLRLATVLLLNEPLGNLPRNKRVNVWWERFVREHKFETKTCELV